MDHEAPWALKLTFDFMKKLTLLNRKLLKQSEKGNTKQVLALLTEGADVNATDDEGWVPLTTALSMDHQETAEALIKAGANVNDVPRNSNFDDMPLMIAARKGFLSTIELMLEAGADVNASTNDGTSALMYAASRGHTAVVQRLIAAGADIHARNSTDCALSCAIYQGRKEVADILRAAGAYLNLEEAAACGQQELVARLLAEGANPNDGAAIVRASFAENEEIVRMLVAAGADVNVQDDEGNTALHYAVRWELDKIARFLLIECNADADIENDEEETPFDLAVYVENSDMVHLFLENRKINVNKAGFCGTTPLQRAVESNDIELVKLFLNYGAKVDVKDDFGETPLSMAKENGNKEIIRLLRAAGAKK